MGSLSNAYFKYAGSDLGMTLERFRRENSANINIKHSPGLAVKYYLNYGDFSVPSYCYRDDFADVASLLSPDSALTLEIKPHLPEGRKLEMQVSSFSDLNSYALLYFETSKPVNERYNLRIATLSLETDVQKSLFYAAFGAVKHLTAIEPKELTLSSECFTIQEKLNFLSTYLNVFSALGDRWPVFPNMVTTWANQKTKNNK